MSGPIVLLPKARPDEDIIGVLKDYLAVAESGELCSIVLAGVMRGGSVRTSFVSGDVSIFETLGAVDCVHHRILTKAIE